jgi:hypothetical protein
MSAMAGTSAAVAARMLGSSKIIAEGTDWRFLNELKRELKA